MIAQALLFNQESKLAVSQVLEGLQVAVCFSSSLSAYKEDILKTKPDIFFIEVLTKHSLEILEVISDIRHLFGAMATIVILGDSMTSSNMAMFLSVGSDQFFSFPLDTALVEDFLSKRTESSFYNTFKYRNVPSRSTEINIKFEVSLKRIHSRGIVFVSSHLIKNGAVLSFDFNNVSADLAFEVQCLVTQSTCLPSKEFEVHAVFFEIDIEKQNSIVHYLRNDFVN